MMDCFSTLGASVPVLTVRMPGLRAGSGHRVWAPGLGAGLRVEADLAHDGPGALQRDLTTPARFSVPDNPGALQRDRQPRSSR
jgi:hypothetical protein